MSESNSNTSRNTFEIPNSHESMTVDDLKGILKEYELDGENPKQRIEALKRQSPENTAIFLTDVNRRIQGSEVAMLHDSTMKIGEKAAINPEDRYDLFLDIMKKVQTSGNNINPARIGDVMAVATVLLHPFKDGNGRTARVLGFIYRDDFDKSDAAETFSQLSESRDIARSRGGFIINGYIPYMGEDVNQSDPQQVGPYIDRLLSKEGTQLYTGPYGQAPLIHYEAHAPRIT